MKTTILTILVILMTFGIKGQVAINEDNSIPDPSAMLDVKSTDKGVLVPRLTTAQRELIPGPANGLLVFDATTKSFWFYSSGVWTELIDRGNSSWEQNGSDISYNNGKVGIGISNPSDRFQVDAGAAEPALRVRQDGATKFRIHANGGTSVGVNSTPPVDGLLVTGEIQPRGNIVTDQNLLIESNGIGTSVQLKTNPNYLFLDGAGLFGFSQDVLIMETGTGSNKVEMNSLGLTTSSALDILISSALASSSISLGNQGITASTSQDIVLETTSATGTITIKIGTNEITIEENGAIEINSSGNDLAIITDGGDLSLTTNNGDLNLDAGNGNVNIFGNTMDFLASGSMLIQSNGPDLDIDGNNNLTLTSGISLKVDAGTDLDLDGSALMTLNAPLIRLNNGGLPAARQGTQVLVNTITGFGAIQPTGASTSVFIGN